MPNLDELHAASVKGDIDMVKSAVKKGGLAAQRAMAKMLRGKSHKEPDADDRGGPSDGDQDNVKFKRSGSISSAGASVGGGT